jgi:hypothetical protein
VEVNKTSEILKENYTFLLLEFNILDSRYHIVIIRFHDKLNLGAIRGVSVNFALKIIITISRFVQSLWYKIALSLID